jgi:hypothetical protein
MIGQNYSVSLLILSHEMSSLHHTLLSLHQWDSRDCAGKYNQCQSLRLFLGWVAMNKFWMPVSCWYWLARYAIDTSRCEHSINRTLLYCVNIRRRTRLTSVTWLHHGNIHYEHAHYMTKWCIRHTHSYQHTKVSGQVSLELALLIRKKERKNRAIPIYRVYRLYDYEYLVYFIQPILILYYLLTILTFLYCNFATGCACTQILGYTGIRSGNPQLVLHRVNLEC